MIRRLLYLSGLAVISAVLNHSAGWGFTAMFWWTDRYSTVSVPNYDQLGSASYFALRGIEQLVIFTIPAFLFVSGFFIAFATGRNKKTVGWNIVGTRIKNLVIPYLIWSLIIITGEILQGASYSLFQVVKMLVFGRAAPPYYYIPLVIQFYLLSPFLVPVAKFRWKSLLAVAATIEIFILTLRYGDVPGINMPLYNQGSWLTASWFFSGHAFWFTFGIVAGFHIKAFKHWLVKAKWGLVAATIITFAAGMIEWEALLAQSGQAWIATQRTLIDTLFAGAFLLCFLAFEQVTLPLSKQIGGLGPKSFGVYLIHSPTLEYASRAIYHIAPWLLAFPVLLLQPVLFILGLGVPLVMMALAKRSPARKFYVYIFG